MIMDLNIFDASHCNELLSTLKKEQIQFMQIFIAIKTVLEFPHLEFCLNKISSVDVPHDNDFTIELSSFLNSDYGDNDSVNYAISLKKIQDVIVYYENQLIELFRNMKNISLSQIDETVLLTKRLIRNFLNDRDEACMNAFRRLEVYQERKKYEEIFYNVETIL